MLKLIIVCFTAFRAKEFEPKCNVETVDLESVTEEEDMTLLFDLLTEFKVKTGSEVAEKILSQWPASLTNFVKVELLGLLVVT